MDTVVIFFACVAAGGLANIIMITVAGYRMPVNRPYREWVDDRTRMASVTATREHDRVMGVRR